MFDKSKQQLIKDKEDLVEENFKISQKLEKLQQRFSVMDKELEEAQMENISL